MALYRCAMCGSSKIVLETKQEGYNKKKGIVGSALFGGIGALAGTSGNTVTYYHCGDCGAVLNRTMYSFEKDALENCLANSDIFESSLKDYKKRYKNIEWEEKQVIIDEAEISEIGNAKPMSKVDIESSIIEYMRNMGVPVPWINVRDKITEILDHNYCSELNGNRVSIRIGDLIKRGVLKQEYIGGLSHLILVTDIEEIKQCALIERMKEITYKLARTKNNYGSIIMQYLSYNLVEAEEIYNCLKQDNHLGEDVIQAEKESALFPKYFISACLVRGGEAEEPLPYHSDNYRYRLATSEEFEEYKEFVKKLNEITKSC